MPYERKNYGVAAKIATARSSPRETRSRLPAYRSSRYNASLAWPTLIKMLSAIGLAATLAEAPSSFAIRGMLLALAVAAMLFILARRTRREQPGPLSWIHLLFFCSGFPALIYQIVWQRALFNLFGSNIQSVTIVVSAFILGLGLGSLLGGALSRVSWVKPVAVFGLAELGVALFGFFSLHIFHLAGAATASESLWRTGALSFALVVVPTVLMGMTLPLLIEHAVRSSHNVGSSVGGLYFANTLGSGMACFVAAGFLLRWLGQSGSVCFAATVNALVGIAGVLYVVLLQSERGSPADFVAPQSQPGKARMLPFSLALVCAAFSGFAALSYEIVWYRLLSFSSDTAPIFACLLGSYLFGLAIGARYIERRARRQEERDTATWLGNAFLAAGIVGFAVAPTIALTSKLVPFNPVKSLGLGGLGYVIMFVMITIGAACMGTIFPLTAHAAVPPNDQAGGGVSYLYASNILGSTLGTLLVGFVLMNSWSLLQISALLLLGSLGCAALVLIRKEGRAWKVPMMTGTVGAIALLAASWPLFPTIYDRLLFKDHFPSLHFQRVISNRTGTVGATADGTVYGGGVYDGRFNVHLLHDVNIILRPYAISALHAAPHRALMIGLGTGSWTQVIANDPEVKDVLAVEINPGYLPLIEQHAQVASLLTNPRVRIVIDDGRRWLASHPEERFDVILMNTSYYWRNHSSNLLSADFLRLVQAHLNPGGVLLYNTTGSDDVVATGLSVFRYGYRVSNALAVSDSPLTFDRARWRQVLLSYRVDGRPVVDVSDPAEAARFEALIGIPDDASGKNWNSIESDAELRSRLHNRLIITDDNMGVEWP